MPKLADILDKLNLPKDAVLSILDTLSARYPDLAVAFGEIATKVEAIPGEILALPTELSSELKDLLTTGRSEIDPDSPVWD